MIVEGIIAWSCWAVGRYVNEMRKATMDDSSDAFSRDPNVWKETRPRHPNGTLKRDENGDLLPLQKNKR